MEVKKVYSVVALLDDVSTHKFLSMRHKLSAIEGSYDNTLPHITISVYDKDLDLNELVQWTQHVANNHYKFKVVYSTVGIFLGSCLIAVPSFSKRLYELYKSHHQRFDECCRDYSALRNDGWFPHTGIWYTTKENARENIVKLSDLFQSIEAEITSLRVTEFDCNSFNKIAEFDLPNSSK